MGGRLSGAGFRGALTQPHRAGLEGGARVASVLGGMLLIGAGLLHISAAGDHTNLPVMAAGFLVVAALQAGLGGLLLVRRAGRLVLAGGIALTLGALATWLVSRTAGLPLLPGGHMEPVGFKDGITVLFETATVPLLAMLASSELDAVRMPSPRLGNQAVAVLGSAMFALFVPAFLLGGGEHHSASEMAQAHGEDGHGHGDDNAALAQAGGDHTHDDATASGHAGAAHEEGGEPRGRPATAAVLADAHHSATGQTRDASDLGLSTADGESKHQSHEGSGQEDGGGGTGGGQQHGSGEHDGDGQRGDGDHGDGDATDGHGEHTGAEPAAENGRRLALEEGSSGEDGSRPRGPALVYYDQADEEMQGHGHDDAPCEPTAEQQSTADTIVADVSAELRQYENNPAEAFADGFNYVFGPTDRMLHMVHLPRVDDADVVKASEIESFIYYMTDTGFVPIGGMFVMPRGATSGPEPGGCLTQWHQHGGFVGRWATAGTSETTPLMMHVFTYPGLDPWGHYTGRELASLWTPGAWVPSVCRSAGDANNGCLP
jgi:hypothetical protein